MSDTLDQLVSQFTGMANSLGANFGGGGANVQPTSTSFTPSTMPKPNYSLAGDGGATQGSNYTAPPLNMPQMGQLGSGTYGMMPPQQPVQPVAPQAMQQAQPQAMAQPAVYNPQQQQARAMNIPNAQPLAQQQAPQQQAPQTYTNETAAPYFKQIVQQESGGRDYDQNGNILTSPAGAMASAQVMPMTLKNPGFGVTPAKDNSPAEINRVGKDYFTSMLNIYKDPVLAAAAYNGGPGRLNAAIEKAKQTGENPLIYMPKETQDYAKTFYKETGHVTGQEATGAAKEPWTLSGTGIRMPGQETAREMDDFHKHQDDVNWLMQKRLDMNTSQPIQKLIDDKLFTHLDATKKIEQAQQNIIQAAKSGNPRDVSAAFSDNLARSAFFGMLGQKNLAEHYANEAGINDSWQPSKIGGQNVSVKYDPRGQAKSGMYIDGDKAGQQIEPENLRALNGRGLSADNLKTAQTQAVQAAQSTYSNLMKQRNALIARGQPESVLQAAGLDEATIKAKMAQSGQDILSAARTQYAGEIPDMTKPQSAMNQPIASAGAPNPTQVNVTPATRTSVLDNWNIKRPTESLSAFDKRQSLTPDDVRSAGEALFNGQMTLKQITGPQGALLKQYAGEYARELANSKGQTWSPVDSERKVKENDKIVQDFTPGGTSGKQVVAFTTATNHINDDFRPAIEALNNGDFRTANRILNEFNSWRGQGKDINNFNIVKTFMGDEVAKSLGGVARGDREEVRHLFDTAANPAQLRAAADQAEKLMAGRVEVLENQYRRTGRDDFYSNIVQNKRVEQVVNNVKEERSARAWAQAHPNDPRSAKILQSLGTQ